MSCGQRAGVSFDSRGRPTLAETAGRQRQRRQARLPAAGARRVLAMVTAANTKAAAHRHERDAAVLVLFSGPGDSPAGGAARRRRPAGHRARVDAAPPRRPGRVPRRGRRSRRHGPGAHRAARGQRGDRHRHRPAAAAGHARADVHPAVGLPRRAGARVLAGPGPGRRRRRGRDRDRRARPGPRLRQPREPADGVPQGEHPPLRRARRSCSTRCWCGVSPVR